MIVDCNGMLHSLNEALAEYALGDGDEPGPDGPDEVVAPIEALVASLVQAIEAAEALLRRVSFDPASLLVARGFNKIEAFRDAVEALYSDADTRHQFQIAAQHRQRERERLKRASRQLLASIRALLTSMPHWTANTQTQAEVEVAIRDHLVELLPIPPYTPQDAEAAYQ